MLPVFWLQAVRCERCYHRSYILRTIPAVERVPPEHKDSQSQCLADPKSDGRVA
ncbi:MAG: hypothetical protein ACHP9V_03780 [Terriglobales bacterium]